MMPATPAPQPADSKLRDCLRRYRKKTSKTAWKQFRADGTCGATALGHLHAAYGTRCIYCDHAHGRSIDHVTPKGSKAAKQLTWSNWRAACMDCNNQKGTKRIVDPVKTDPRTYVVFDIVTGEPVVVATGKAKPVADATVVVLDNHTLNEARRAACVAIVAALKRVVDGEPGAIVSFMELLERTTPHRAVLRELVLEEDRALNPYRDVVEAALVRMPTLAGWAAQPTPPRAPS
jgi:5-methylcytosine-specific restriction endonuclease McrA